MSRRILALLAVTLFVALPSPAVGAGRRGGKRAAASAAAQRRSPPDVNLKPDDSDRATGASPAPATTSTSGAPPQRGPTRIDFDDRLIQGQTNKSGAVYLYDRKELKQRSMVKIRQSFREEILKTVYDR